MVKFENIRRLQKRSLIYSSDYVVTTHLPSFCCSTHKVWCIFSVKQLSGTGSNVIFIICLPIILNSLKRTENQYDKMFK